MTDALYDFTGRRVLVTGGAGFIGSHTVDLLVAAGCGEIVVIDDMVRGRPENLRAAMATGPVRLIQDDIRNRALLAREIEGCDTVFHLAALRITQCAAEPARAIEVMINATFDVVDLCVAANVRKLVMASTASVYGMAESFPTHESHHPYGNRTLYGAAKAFGEGLLRAYNDMHALNYTALRYFNVYGERMDIHGRYTEVLVRWMERIEAGLPPIIFGDGQQTMDMVHVTDVARATLLAAQAPVCDEVFNVGCGAETSLLQLARSLAEVMGKPGLIPIHEKERAVNPVPRRLADVSAARAALGFVAQRDLHEGLRGLVAWWRENRPALAAGRAA